ncbi:MAG: class I SAM-dependent methyltransferase, partial [Alphaproteobacteria bacterium]|nr:class I SAM-dependent methyltransferase [Alphaproteobacteria bacterium]
MENVETMAGAVDVKGIFSGIVERREWGGESGFGEGATLFATERLRAELPPLLGQLRINTILDAGCGGLNWIRHLDYEFDRYIGLDIVDEIIAGLKLQELPRNFSVTAGDFLKDILPRSDAVLCRDCLTHFSNAAVRRALFRFKKSGARYLITTTWPLTQENRDIISGGWRSLNLQVEPFCLPRPTHLIVESEYEFGQKALGIWDLDSIVLFDEEDLDDYLRFVEQNRNFTFIIRSIVANRSVVLTDHERLSCGRWDRSYKLIQFWDGIDPPQDVRNLVDEWKSAVPSGCHILFNDKT